MNIIESINFLDKYWDECMEDQSISNAIENESDILSLQEIYLTKFKDETKKEQYSQLEKSINDINSTILSVTKSTDEAIDLLFKSQNEVNSISHINEFKNSEISQARTNIGYAYSFYSKLDSFNEKKLGEYKSGDDQNNFSLLDDLIEFRNLSDKLIKFPNLFQDKEILQFFLAKNNKLNKFIEDKLGEIKKDISKSFSNRQFKDNSILATYRKYYTYIERLSIKKESLQLFQEDCVNSIVDGILDFYSINPSTIDKIINRFQTKYFNYKDKRIKEICELTELTPTSIPKINVKEDPLELRLIHFIVNLPQTIERSIYELYQVFRNNNLSTAFLNTLCCKYSKSLIDSNIYKNSILDESIYWCFIFATTSYHRITLNITSRYINTIIKIIGFTVDKSLVCANDLYSKYISEKSCPLKKLKFDKDKYIKYDDIKRQAYVKEFSNDLISIVKDEVSPIAQCVSIFYDMKGQQRENQFNYKWYNQTIDIQKACNWFFHYNAIAETYLIVHNMKILYDVNDQANLYFVNCMLYHYTKYSEGLRKSATDRFYKAAILKEVNKGQKIDLEPLNKTPNIPMESVVNIIYTYKTSTSLDEAQKYMRLYIIATAMFIHQKLQMIHGDVNNFIIKFIKKKQENIKSIYDIIYEDCVTFLISKMSEIPKFIIIDIGKSVFNVDQFSIDVHQVLQCLN